MWCCDLSPLTQSGLRGKPMTLAMGRLAWLSHVPPPRLICATPAPNVHVHLSPPMARC